MLNPETRQRRTRRFHRFLRFLTAQRAAFHVIALNRRRIPDRARNGKRSKTVKNGRKTVKDDGHAKRSQNCLLGALTIRRAHYTRSRAIPPTLVIRSSEPVWTPPSRC